MKYGYAVDEIIMIDDSPEKLQRQPTRRLSVGFTGDPSDKVLLIVMERLKSIAKA